MAKIQNFQLDTIATADKVSWTAVGKVNTLTNKGSVVDGDEFPISDSAVGAGGANKALLASKLKEYMLGTDTVTIGDNTGDNILASSGSQNLKLTTGGANKDIELAPNGSGVVIIPAAGLKSKGDEDLVLKTGNTTTGSIEIVDGAAGAIKLKPNAAGIIEVGSGGNDGDIRSSGNFDLVLKTGNATTGSLTFTNGANGDITFVTNGDGRVVLPSGAPTAAAHATNKSYVDSLVQGIRWLQPVKCATIAILPTSPDYDNAGNFLEADDNGTLANIDSVPVLVGDRILVKNQASTAGSLTFDVENVPAADEYMRFEVNDVYYQINFDPASADSTAWGAQSGVDGSNRKVRNIDQNQGSIDAALVATRIRDAFNAEQNITSSGSGVTVILTQTEPRTQIVGNNVTAEDAGDTSNESAVAGASGYNGIYTVTVSQADQPYKLTRVVPDSINDVTNAAVFVQFGPTNQDSAFVMASDFLDDIDKSSQNWVQFTGAGQIVADPGLSKSGNVMKLGNFSGLGALGDNNLVHGDELVMDDDGTVKKVTPHQMAILFSGASEFTTPTNGQLALATRGVALSKLAGGTNDHIVCAKGVSANTAYQAPAVLSEAAAGTCGIDLANFSATGGDQSIKLDYKMARAEKDITADAVGNITQDTRANTLKIANIYTAGGADLSMAGKSAHPLYNMAFIMRNGVMLEGFTNRTHEGALNGNNQWMIKYDGSSNLDFYLTEDASANLQSDADLWGGDDVIVFFPVIA